MIKLNTLLETVRTRMRSAEAEEAVLLSSIYDDLSKETNRVDDEIARIHKETLEKLQAIQQGP